MNKNIGIILGLVGIIIIGGIYFSVNRSDEPVNVASKNHSEVGEVKEAGAGAGSYEVYAPEKIAKAATGEVVLFFKASWCPSCRALDKDIKENLGKIPADLTILQVDYDNSQELKQKYGVTYQHTMVLVDEKGKLIKKWSGSPTLAALLVEVS